MPPPINILAIESSCDETSAAVISEGKILSNVIAGQKVHEVYGGVVPELASRAHQQNIIPVVAQALNLSKIQKNDLSAVAYTKGPRLLGSLLVGVSFAKSFAQGLGIPTIDVNHLQAHVLSLFIDEPKPSFPFLCLTVSGGHTQLVLVSDYLKMEIIGTTLDDAAGECFDKAAKIMGLTYPGGPEIDKLSRTGNPQKFNFPIADVPGFDFSFSGLKTNFLYFFRERMKSDALFFEKECPDICASLQHAIVTALIIKLKSAALKLNIREVALSGGVSANSYLRHYFEKTGGELGWKTHYPKISYCTDNAAMIAMAGYYKYLKGEFADERAVPVARWVG